MKTDAHNLIHAVTATELKHVTLLSLLIGVIPQYIDIIIPSLSGCKTSACPLHVQPPPQIAST